MNTLALVPAKGKSIGIPGKNVRNFAGKPLMVWAIDVGLATCERTVVSTDDIHIAAIARQYGAIPLMRDRKLCRDDTPMLPVIQDALKRLRPWTPDVVVLLQPTQPLRRVEHIRYALQLLECSEADSVVSVVTIPEHFSPDYAMRIEDGKLIPFLGESPTRRQDCRPAFSRDGTVYATRTQIILAGSLYGNDCRAFVVPHSQSVNLDSEEDWKAAVSVWEQANARAS